MSSTAWIILGLAVALLAGRLIPDPGPGNHPHCLPSKEANPHPPWFSAFVHFEAKTTRIHCCRPR